MIKYVKANRDFDSIKIEQDRIYDEVSRVLTDYELGDCGAEDLYKVLVKVQNHWEDVITAEV